MRTTARQPPKSLDNFEDVMKHVINLRFNAMNDSLSDVSVASSTSNDLNWN